ncbi:hypothetical protein SO802_005125, partial [Lithocarpus litseifolius]
MDTKLGLTHLTKDMQDLLFIIRDSVRFKNGPTNENLVTDWFVHFRWDLRCKLWRRILKIGCLDGVNLLMG